MDKPHHTLATTKARALTDVMGLPVVAASTPVRALQPEALPLWPQPAESFALALATVAGHLTAVLLCAVLPEVLIATMGSPTTGARADTKVGGSDDPGQQAGSGHGDLTPLL